MGTALAFLGPHVMRTRVYVDGFNLFYGALKGTSFKWVDLVRLSTLVLPAEYEIEGLLYFTARVSGQSDSLAPARQQVYLNALATLPLVELHYGRFLAKTVWRPLANLPIADRRIDTPQPIILPEGHHRVFGKQHQTLSVGRYPQRRGNRNGSRRRRGMLILDAVIAEFHTKEGKGSDVNLAVHLLNDAWKGLFEAAVVISNDTDLVLPIRMVSRERNLPVFVVCPGRWQVAPQLREAATHIRHIRSGMLRAAQFPETLSGTTITKPAGW